MLRKDELIPAVRLELAVGERPFGHFDHSASRLAGPQAPRGRGVSGGDSTKKTSASSYSRRVSFKVKRDPRTAAVTYVRSTK